jgi:MSHA biogenesis protein MshK
VYRIFAITIVALFVTVSAWAFEDPTRPPADATLSSAVASEPHLPVLSSIVYSDKRRLAVIDGEIFLEGQSKGDVALVEVLPDNVLVRIGAEARFTLHLGSGQINKELK